MTLDFAASTDNVKVIGYDLSRNGAKVWTLTDGTTSLTYGGLACGTSYMLGVNAFDAAGNHSASAMTSATTLACPTTSTTLTTTTTTTTTGSVLYAKAWEDGLIDSNGWSRQDSSTLGTAPVNGIIYGTVKVDSTVSDSGTYSGRFDLPGSNTNMQGVVLNHSRAVANPSDEWFSVAFRFPSNWPQALVKADGTNGTITLLCPNYYSVNSCMVNIGATGTSMFTLINSGACPFSGTGSGCPWYSATPEGGNYSVCRGFTGSQCGPLYIVPPGQLALNVWHEMIMHVRYTLDNTGVVEFWHRLKGQTAWTKTVSEIGGFPTLQTGATAFGTTVTASNINGWSSTDRALLYRLPNPNPINYWFDNFCRATSFGAAASCLG